MMKGLNSQYLCIVLQTPISQNLRGNPFCSGQRNRYISGKNISLFYTVFFLTFLLAFNVFLPAFGNAEPLLISPDSNHVRLGSHMQLLEDATKSLQIEDVASVEFATRFEETPGDSINKGITDSYYWFKFSVLLGKTERSAETIGRDHSGKQWYLYLGKHLDFYDEVTFFWQEQIEGDGAGDQSGWKVQTFGMQHAEDNGKRDPLFARISLSPDASGPLTVYMRIAAESGFFIEPILYSPDGFDLFIKKLSIFYGSYYGIVLSIIIYNLFHFFFLRDKVRLLFIMYATTLCLYFLVANELTLTIFPPQFLVETRKTAQFLILFAMFQVAWFTMAFLGARKLMPILYRLLQGVAIAALVLIAMLPFFSYLTMLPIILDYGLVNAFAIMFAGFTAWFKGYKPARFFVFAWFFFMGGGVIYDFNFKGLFPYAFIGNNALQAGSGIEMILLSLAIADRVKFLFEKLNKVQERRQKQLYELSHQLVQTEERERRRIATILHDSIGQTLFATKWEIKRLLKSLPSEDKEDSMALPYLESCIGETRSLTAELYPQELYEDSGLVTAIEALANNFTKRFSIQVNFLNSGDDPGIRSEKLKFIIYRAVSELLNNIAKHAEAAQVTIKLHEINGTISVSVQDDGIGFDYSPDQNNEVSGFGLFSIQERLHRVGGTLLVERIENPGGAKVTLSIPKDETHEVHRYAPRELK